jgi:pyruvate/2-oxoglutarate dehydrogenase complex dihydrolipoamide acyltransferase (E2) component
LRSLVVLAGVVLALAATGGSAHADGDPASDILLGLDVFYPIDAHSSNAQQAALNAAVAAGKRAGVPLKVAIIATRYDLGSVPVLYDKPQQYASFLGQELFYVNKARLIVVMPNGYGVWRRRPLPAREQAAVTSLPPPGSANGDRLVAAANVAARRLLGLHGIHVAAAPGAPGHGSSATSDRVKIAVAALLIAALGVAAAFLVRLRRGRAGAA